MAKRETPSFDKSPPELIDRFGAVMDRYPDAERRKMFGYPAAFVGGNMATGLFADKWVVRLPGRRDRAGEGRGRGGVRADARQADEGVRGRSRRPMSTTTRRSRPGSSAESRYARSMPPKK